VGLAEARSPVSTADRGDGELGINDGTTDGSGNFLRALGTEANVAIVVSNGNVSLYNSRFEQYKTWVSASERQETIK
jgi:hypothetical protein